MVFGIVSKERGKALCFEHQATIIRFGRNTFNRILGTRQVQVFFGFYLSGTTKKQLNKQEIVRDDDAGAYIYNNAMQKSTKHGGRSAALCRRNALPRLLSLILHFFPTTISFNPHESRLLINTNLH
jgi:hypothetical protein